MSRLIYAVSRQADFAEGVRRSWQRRLRAMREVNKDGKRVFARYSYSGGIKTDQIAEALGAARFWRLESREWKSVLAEVQQKETA